MHLMKVIHGMPAMLSAAILAFSIVAASVSATEVSESKTEDTSETVSTTAKDNPKENVPCFNEIGINMIELEDEVSCLIRYDSNSNVLQEFTDTSTTQDIGTIEDEDVNFDIEEDVDDEDPFIYLDKMEIPEPDWTIIPNLDPSLLKHFIDEAYKNEIDPCVVIALSESESGFYTDVESYAGCYGLMQLHPLYYPEDMYDPYKNIEYGCETIAKFLSKYGDYVTALNVYANGHIGTDFTYQIDVMERAEKWRNKLIAAHIL